MKNLLLFPLLISIFHTYVLPQNVPTAERNTQCSAAYTLFRTLDGTCTNDAHRNWGKAHRLQFSYFDIDASKFYNERPLKSAREISNIVFDRKGLEDSFVSDRRISSFVTFFGQFVDHNMFSISESETERKDIPISSDDQYLKTLEKTLSKRVNGQLVIEFMRSEKKADDISGKERPENKLTSALDLDAVYGVSDDQSKKLREGKYGLLKAPNGLLPVDDSTLQFISGDDRVGESPVLTAIHIVFLLEHNRIASEMKDEGFCSSFSSLDSPDCDNELFRYARRMNGAQFQKIVYEEFFPVLTGTQSPYRGYDENIDPTVSMLFSTAAFRYGHSMVRADIEKKGPGMTDLGRESTRDILRQNKTLFDKPNQVEEFIRGSIFQLSGEIDTIVDFSLRNELFHNSAVKDRHQEGGEQDKKRGGDLVSRNIQRSRDHNIPFYNDIRDHFNQGRAKSFADISSDVNVQEALEKAYTSVDNVEAYVGLLAEDHVNGASFGPTMIAVWKSEFDRISGGDRLHYRRQDVFPDKLRAYSRFYSVMNSNNKNVMKDIIVRNTKVTPGEIGGLWFANQMPPNQKNPEPSPDSCGIDQTTLGCRGVDETGFLTAGLFPGIPGARD